MFIFLLILFELYFPSIYYKNFNVNPDFLLLLVLFISFRYNAKKTILSAFFIGFIKDVLIHQSWFGFIALLTSIFAYVLNFIKKLNNIYISYLLCILLVFVYFYFYYTFQFSGGFIICVELSFIKTLITLILYFIINFIFNKRLFF